jgi:hypothetical protein
MDGTMLTNMGKAWIPSSLYSVADEEDNDDNDDD